MRRWLSGIGAETLASSLLSFVAFELWSDHVLVFSSRPEFEFVALPAYAYGAAIGLAIGGWRSLLALGAVASLWVSWIPFSPERPDADFFLREIWTYAGIALGALIWASRPHRSGSTAFSGVGVYGLLVALFGTAYTIAHWSGLAGPEVASVANFFWCLTAGVGAGSVNGRMRQMYVLAMGLAIALPSLDEIAHQGWMWQYDGVWILAGMASGLAGGIAFATAALVTQKRIFARQARAPLVDA